MELIDTHCHLDAAEFAEKFNETLSKVKAANIIAIIIPGIEKNGWKRILTLCRKNPGLFPALGLHPVYLPQHKPIHLEELLILAQQGKLVAIGEVGLDYHIPDLDHTAQQHLFEQQLHIASITALPVLLHVRKAHDQVLATLRRKHFSHGGIVHAFSGSYQQATQYIRLGFGISFGGTLTYNRAKRIRAIATQLPKEVIVLETDAPDLPPANHRTKNNHPEYLTETLAVLATLRDESQEDIAHYTTINAKRFLNLPEISSLRPTKNQQNSQLQ